MQSWKEYYDVFRDDVGLYIEKLNVTELRYIKWVAACVRRLQSTIRLVIKEKELLYDSNKKGYPLGDDVLQIILLADSQNNELLSTGIKQFQMTYERSLIGMNEEPMNFSLNKDLPYLDKWGKEAMIYTVIDNVVRIYPDYKDKLRLVYYIDYHDFTPYSTQWQAWFVNGSFYPDMLQTVPPPEYAQFDIAWKPYCLREYHRQIMSEIWKDYDREYREAMQLLEMRKPVINKETRSPYYPIPII
ncbi:MAG: hypothetical protein KatS3mg083_123 [Candidatus Dojkabacteria bacterium]|nr:MAG: hypothetical protein KatS3mg083_123 [Candidatus Dojkabacteria bacterium]